MAGFWRQFLLVHRGHMYLHKLETGEKSPHDPLFIIPIQSAAP